MVSDELELMVVAVEGGLAVGAGGDVSEITSMADLGGGGTVGLAVGVEVTTGRHASVGVVTELAICFKKKKGLVPKEFFHANACNGPTMTQRDGGGKRRKDEGRGQEGIAFLCCSNSHRFLTRNCLQENVVFFFPERKRECRYGVCASVRCDRDDYSIFIPSLSTLLIMFPGRLGTIKNPSKEYHHHNDTAAQRSLLYRTEANLVSMM